jgi:toxin secretion/phage lysis holin
MSINDILGMLKGAADMGGCWYLFVIPLVFDILDIITGFTAAVANKNVSSSAMREGLFHKLGFIFALILAALLQYASGLLDLGVEIPTLGAVAVFVVLTEAVSILENIAEMNPALANNGFFKIFESVIHSSEKD